MKIEVKKTTELSEDDKSDICSLFKAVFNIVKTHEDFLHQFERNEFGFSYFGLIYENDRLIGSYAVIPFEYIYNDERVIFAQSVDTMIDKKYRGNPFLLKRLSSKVYKRLKKDSIPFVFGFPNDNIYLVRKKILKWKDIYNLDIYLLPIKFDNIKGTLRPMNFILKAITRTVNTFLNDEVDLVENFKIYKSNSLLFNEYRFTNEYEKYHLSKDVFFYYKIQEFNNINTAFIVDVFPLTRHNLDLTVKKIIKLKKNIDLIAYFGFLPFNPVNLLRVPERHKPKNTFMSGLILDSDKVKEDIFNVKKWRVNLSNFDWI
jgi:hypothetical protein